MGKSRLIFLLALLSQPAFASDFKAGVYAVLSDPGIWLTANSKYGELLYETNEEIRPGFELRYKQFGFTLSPPFFGRSQALIEHPPTTFFDYSTYYYGDKWGGEMYAQYFKGFFGTDNHDSVLNNPTLSLYSINFNIYRTVNSGSRVYRMMDGIEENGIKWNFYYLFGAAWQNILTQQPLFESIDPTDSSRLDDIKRLKMLDASAGVGATINTYLFGFYVDPTLFIGFGPQYRTTNANIDKFGQTIKVNLKFNCGFHSKWFDTGLSAQNDLNSMELDDENIEFHSTIVKMFLIVFI
jgi:hypothetical protein